MCVFLPGVSFAAQNFTGPVQVDYDGSGNGLGIGRAPSSRPLRIKAPNGTAVINMENDAAQNVFQMTINSNGAAFFRGRDGNNDVNFILNADLTGSSYVVGPLGVGTSSPSGTVALEVNGTTSTSVLEITGGSDLSEQFRVTAGKDTEPGTVLCIDANNPGDLVCSSKAYDRTVAGVRSGAGGLNVGMMMGQKGTGADGKHPVALTGRVYVKATAANGAIVPGDMLTTSEVPGHAMKATDHVRAQGAIIGKAMTSLDADTGLVLVLISLQ
jgi:hypothetical protein